jgi:hypothetical protein
MTDVCIIEPAFLIRFLSTFAPIESNFLDQIVGWLEPNALEFIGAFADALAVFLNDATADGTNTANELG